MSTSRDQDVERFRLRLEMAGEEGVRKNLEHGLYGEEDSAHAVLARKFIEEEEKDRETRLGPSALKGPAKAIRHSKEFGPTKALRRSVGAGTRRSSQLSRWWPTAAVVALVLASIALAKIAGWFCVVRGSPPRPFVTGYPDVLPEA